MCRAFAYYVCRPFESVNGGAKGAAGNDTGNERIKESIYPTERVAFVSMYRGGCSNFLGL